MKFIVGFELYGHLEKVVACTPLRKSNPRATSMSPIRRGKSSSAIMATVQSASRQMTSRQALVDAQSELIDNDRIYLFGNARH
jgi:hypothetical protein